MLDVWEKKFDWNKWKVAATIIISSNRKPKVGF